MIVRRTSGTHVYLRCQLRLSSQPASASSIFLAHTQLLRGARFQHNGAKLDGLKDPESLNEAPHSSRNDYNGVSSKTTKSSQPRCRGFRRPLEKHRLTESPLGRLHGFRGHKLREQRFELDVDTLGNKSEVIVLRDAGVRFNPRPEMEEFEKVEKVDILAQLDAERGLVGQDEVERNIEELTPKQSARLVSWEELQSIQQQLVTGFTMSQLLRYRESIEAREKLAMARDEEHTQEKALSAVVRKTEWMPGTSDSGEVFEERPLRGYRSEAYTPKQRLVLLLLRQHWRLEARDVTESTGEIELELRSTELELLISRLDRRH